MKGRIPSFLLLDAAQTFAEDLRRLHEEAIAHGRVPVHTWLELPALCGNAGYQYLQRWRSKYGITYRTVSLRYKCARSVLLERLLVFWSNVLRVRILHQRLFERGAEPRQLCIEGFDQKPLWFTACLEERTFHFKGMKKVAVKENVPLSRSRFTAMTRCTWPEPPSDGKELAILFKAGGKDPGARIREDLKPPRGVLLQFQERGSYREENVVTYLEWILDRSRMGPDTRGDAGGAEPRGDAGGAEPCGEIAPVRNIQAIDADAAGRELEAMLGEEPADAGDVMDLPDWEWEDGRRADVSAAVGDLDMLIEEDDARNWDALPLGVGDATAAGGEPREELAVIDCEAEDLCPPPLPPPLTPPARTPPASPEPCSHDGADGAEPPKEVVVLDSGAEDLGPPPLASPARTPPVSPEPCSPDGAVGAEPRAAPEAAARPGVAEAGPRRRRVLYLLDWFAPHQSQKLKDIVHEAGHAILLIGGHLTSLVQVEDTHLHGPMTMLYKRRETASAMQQLRIRPDKLPSTSRQTVMERAYDAYMDVDHSSCSHGFVANGIANALDGSQDDELTPEVLPFWTDLDMDSVRRRIKAEVDEALSHGRVTRFEDYATLLEEYKYHKPFSEGQEAFGVEVRPDGQVVEAPEPEMTDETDGEETGACDARGEASEEDGGAEPRGDPGPHPPLRSGQSRSRTTRMFDASKQPARRSRQQSNRSRRRCRQRSLPWNLWVAASTPRCS